MLTAGLPQTAQADGRHDLGETADIARTSGRHLTPWVLDVVKMKRGMAPELDWTSPEAPSRDELEKAMASRPTLSGPELRMEGDWFILHYTTEGDDAVTEEQALAAYDAIIHAGEVEIGQLGYEAPPSDGVKGGDGRYDFYFTKQRATYGVCYGDEFVDDNSMTSYIALGSWMSEGEIQVTVAHEFFHALHYTMDALEETWWYEVTATWMEEQVYDTINDYYNYLPSTLNSPSTPLTESSSIMYANSIWALSLSEAYGVDVIQDIWHHAAQGTSKTALASNRAILDGIGGDGYLADLHNWRESFVDRARFEEGASYPAAKMTATVTTFPMADLSGSIAGTGANLIEVPGDGGAPTTLTVSLANSKTIVGSLLVKESVNGADRFTEIRTDAAPGQGFTATVSDFGGRWTGAYLVLTNTADSGTDSYAVHVEAPGWTGGDSGGGGCSTTGPSAGASALGLAAVGLVGLRTLRRRRA